MNEKRFKKLNSLRRRDDLYTIEGDRESPLALIAWGSVAGLCLEAMELARERGLKVKLLVPRLLYPINEDVYRSFFTSVEAGLVVEQSHQGQLHRLLRMFVDLPTDVRSFARSGANPFRPVEIVEELRNLMLSLQRRLQESLQPQE
jgi:2-oxoglutarate ferredoxin oxidoreductase subunit alpha